MRFHSLLFWSICLLGSANALAWGADGHRLIAELAEAQLAPAAKAEVEHLLGQEPGATMVSVSTWADEVRRPAGAPMHYVNLPLDDCNYVRSRDCEDGRCVIEAIRRQVDVLKSGAPDVERLVALKYVVHFIGDVHQPLHVGLASDKGGNQFQVRAFGRGTNLHGVWDRELIAHRPGGQSQLLRDAGALGPAGDSRSSDPVKWAGASCVISRSSGFYPEDRRIDGAYIARWDSALVTQLALAGRRLAQTLNDALMPKR